MATYGLPQNKLVSYLRWFMLFALLAVVQVMLACSNCYTNLDLAWRNFLYSFSLFSLLWLGNGYISNNLNLLASWKESPFKRFVLTLLIVFLYSGGIVFLVNWFWFVFLPKQDISYMAHERVMESMIMQMVVTYFITMTIHAVVFLRGWREAAVSAERFQKENALSKYEALKNQVNPHFLFNSLNALTSLVHPSPDLAVKFIKQLSEVYRYVLDSQHKEVVELEDELAFVQRYVFLQQIRHADGLQVFLPAHVPTGYFLPPLALQMLLENAIKHNKILAKEPLHIQVTIAGDALSIENNLQPKARHEPPSGLGLPNIEARYQMLTNRKMEVASTPTSFVVRLPLLTFQ